MESAKKYTKKIGSDTYILNVVRGKYGSLVYQMWCECNGKMIKESWTTRRRLDKESKEFFGV